MKRPLVSRLMSKKIWLPIFAGGVALQSVSGCDPTVRDTVLTGIQTSLVTLTTAMFNAFFQALSNVGNSTSQPVVRAAFEHLRSMVA